MNLRDILDPIDENYETEENFTPYESAINEEFEEDWAILNSFNEKAQYTNDNGGIYAE